MPNLFTVSGYKIYFWSNEDGEPIHVHISKGKPFPNSTKIWLTKKGGCILANIWKPDSKKGIKYINDVYISAVFSHLFRMEKILRNR